MYPVQGKAEGAAGLEPRRIQSAGQPEKRAPARHRPCTYMYIWEYQTRPRVSLDPIEDSSVIVFSTISVVDVCISIDSLPPPTGFDDGEGDGEREEGGGLGRGKALSVAASRARLLKEGADQSSRY